MKTGKRIGNTVLVLLILYFFITINDDNKSYKIKEEEGSVDEAASYFNEEVLEFREFPSYLSEERYFLIKDIPFNEEEFDKIDAYLNEQVPEFEQISSYISKKTEGRAFFITRPPNKKEELYDASGNLLGVYYTIYAGEQWEDHSANWEWFYVNEELNEIFWIDIVDMKYYTLEEWRNMDSYKEQMKEIEEFLKRYKPIADEILESFCFEED